MSSILRNPWLIDLTRKKLADGIAQRDGGAVELGKVLDTIGPLGELQFPGDKFKLLQVIQVSPLNLPRIPFPQPALSLHDDHHTHNFRSAVSKSISCGKLKYLIFSFLIPTCLSAVSSIQFLTFSCVPWIVSFIR